MGCELKPKRKNYIVSLQHCSKLRKKINKKLYLKRSILILKNLPFTFEILDNCSVLIYYIFTVF